MSTGAGESGRDTLPTNITLRLGESGEWWVVTDEDTGVTTQGRTRGEALTMLDDAVALYHGDIGHEPTDQELRDLGLDPERARSSSGDLPDVLKQDE